MTSYPILSSNSHYEITLHLKDKFLGFLKCIRSNCDSKYIHSVIIFNKLSLFLRGNISFRTKLKMDDPLVKWFKELPLQDERSAFLESWGEKIPGKTPTCISKL